MKQPAKTIHLWITAASLAGILAGCGLLSPTNQTTINYSGSSSASQTYTSTTRTNPLQAFFSAISPRRSGRNTGFAPAMRTGGS